MNQIPFKSVSNNFRGYIPMVQEFIRNNPDQYFVNEETGETYLAQELAELYCSVNNGKKLKKTLRRAFGDKA